VLDNSFNSTNQGPFHPGNRFPERQQKQHNSRSRAAAYSTGDDSEFWLESILNELMNPEAHHWDWFEASVGGEQMHLIAHDQLKFLKAQAPLRVAQPPVVRDAEEVLVCHVQLRLKWLQPGIMKRVSDPRANDSEIYTVIFTCMYTRSQGHCYLQSVGDRHVYFLFLLRVHFYCAY
jgi:hypothetical protein